MSTEILAYYITWTTYGAWMPGDARGWRRKLANRKSIIQPPRYSDGSLAPQPLLEDWCRDNMKGDSVVLSHADRLTVEHAVREHCDVRGWGVLAINPRSNHVHSVIQAYPKPSTVRDQLKANCTRRLRQQEAPLVVEKTWTTGGDIEYIYDEDDLAQVIQYVLEAQD